MMFRQTIPYLWYISFVRFSFCATFVTCKMNLINYANTKNYDVHGSTLSAMLRGLYAAKGYS